MNDMSEKDRLAVLLAGVRARVPASATTLQLETSDQNMGYGFMIRDVVDSLGNSVVTDDELDQLNDDMYEELDLNWNSAVRESKQGYADVALPDFEIEKEN